MSLLAANHIKDRPRVALTCWRKLGLNPIPKQVVKWQLNDHHGLTIGVKVLVTFHNTFFPP